MPIPFPRPATGPQRNVVDGRVLKHLQRRFNESVTIEQLTDVPDNQGGSTRTWATLATVNAALEPMSTEERLARGVTEATAFFTVYIAYRPDVDARNRVRIGAIVYDISDVTDMGDQQLILALTVSQRFRK